MITKHKNISYFIPDNQPGYNSIDSTVVSVNTSFHDYSRTGNIMIFITGSVNTWTKPTTTGYKFPGSQHVNYKTLKTGFWLTRSHLVKNDLNGHFLTDQPGQPFNGDPGNKAGFDLPPP